MIIPANSKTSQSSLYDLTVDQTRSNLRLTWRQYQTRPTMHKRQTSRSLYGLRKRTKGSQHRRRGEQAKYFATKAVRKFQKDVSNDFQHDCQCQPGRREPIQTAPWFTSSSGLRALRVPDLINTIPATVVVNPTIFISDKLSSNNKTLNKVINKIPIPSHSA